MPVVDRSPAREQAIREWASLRPRFERWVFRAGYQEIHRRTGVSVSAIYALMNDIRIPNHRTRRDIRVGLEAWEAAEGFSRSER